MTHVFMKDGLGHKKSPAKAGLSIGYIESLVSQYSQQQ